MYFNPKECDVNVGKLDSTAEDLLDMVSRISGMSGDMEAHFNNAAMEFSDLIAEDVYATASDNKDAWGEALTACWHVYGVCTKWSGEVERYRQNIDGLQEEWDAALRDNFGYQDPDNVHISEAKRLKAEELNERAATYWEELEGHAEDNTANLEGGPTIANLRELIDAGILGFAIYNSTRQFMYYPTTEGNGEEHAEELLEYIEEDKEPDAHYYHLLAQLATINGLALDGQRNGNQLRPEQIEYLEEFYATLDDPGNKSTDMFGLFPKLEENEAFSDAEREELMEALGGGLLALSDGQLGGGYEHLPEGVQTLVEGPDDWPIGSPSHESDDKEEERRYESWIDSAAILGDLLQAAPSYEGQPMQGGTAFSAHLTVSISETMDSEYQDTQSEFPEVLDVTDKLEPLLDVTTRNPEANAVLLTGETTNGNPYSHPGLGDIDIGETLGNLYQADWPDDGETVAQITDWIPEYAGSDDPKMMELAGDSSAGLIEAIASDNDLYLDLIGVEFEEKDNNLDKAKTSFTEKNPEIAESFFGVFHSYLEDFGGEVDSGTHEYNASEQHLNLDPESRARFMQYIAGDEESAIRMISSVEAQKMENLSFDGLDPEKPEVAGSENGTLQGLLDTALQNEAMNRTANEDEATAENVERQREAATLVSDMALSMIKEPAGANPVTSLGADILEMIVKDEIQNTLEEEIQEDIGDFAEAKGDTHTSEAEVRRDASLYIINQLIDSEDAGLSIDDLRRDDKQSLALVGEEDDERVATGSHEVYSRDRSTLDSGLREILESHDIPPGQGNSAPADEFMGNYTESHGEQYDDIVNNLRVDKPSDIAELAGRSPD